MTTLEKYLAAAQDGVLHERQDARFNILQTLAAGDYYLLRRVHPVLIDVAVFLLDFLKRQALPPAAVDVIEVGDDVDGKFLRGGDGFGGFNGALQGT